MKVDIYKSRTSKIPGATIYLFIMNGIDVSCLSNEKVRELGEVIFQKTIDIQPGQNRIALDTDEAMNNINAYGFHIQTTRIEPTITTEGR